MHSKTALLLGALTMSPLVLGAQSRGDGFLFGRPSATFTLRGGFASPTAGGDVFAFTSKQLTVGRGDFGSGAIGADLGVRVADRLELQFGASVTGRTVNSEFRDWVDNDNRPIEQQTSFRRTPLTAGLKYYLSSPGRTIGRLAWIPSKFTPFVAAGAGTMWFNFSQSGDFVDFKSLDVFRTNLKSKGWAPMAYGSGGVEYSLTPRIGLTSEARYERASGTMSRSSFEGFDRIDLSALTANVGLSFRF